MRVFSRGRNRAVRFRSRTSLPSSGESYEKVSVSTSVASSRKRAVSQAKQESWAAEPGTRGPNAHWRSSIVKACFPSKAAAAAWWRQEGTRRVRRSAAKAPVLEAELPVDRDVDPAPGDVQLVVLVLLEREIEAPGDRRREVVRRAAPDVEALGLGLEIDGESR